MISIAGRQIGRGLPCFVIAEAGVNHNGRRDLALQLIDAAAAAGADAIKFQTFTADALVTRSADKAPYQRVDGENSGSQHGMLASLELPWDDLEAVRAHCDAIDILFLSTPFDEDSADRLTAKLGMAAFKVSSGDLTNTPLLAHLSAKGLPIILSTGMATLDEIRTAVRFVQSPFALLHCVSCYPAAPADVNLRAMKTMALEFPVPIGYSDHTLGLDVALAAVALGATILEKHLTLDRALPGPDHRASLEPADFERLVAGVRDVELALGHGRKEPAEAERAVAQVARRSLVAAVDISAGTLLTGDLIAVKRPGTGLTPGLRGTIIGRTARQPIPADTLLSLDMLS